MKKMIVQARVLAYLSLSGLPDRAAESLRTRLNEAVANGNVALQEQLERSLNNRINNPIVARLTLEYSPSLKAAQEAAATLKRDPATATDPVTGKIRPASLGLNTPQGFVIDLTEGAVAQLSKSGVPTDLMQQVALNQLFTADVELREMGEWLPDVSGEGRREGREIQIQTGNATFTNQRIVLDTPISDTHMQIMGILANASAIAQRTVGVHRVVAPRATPKVSRVAGSAPEVPLFDVPEKKDNELDSKYEARVATARKAFAIQHKIDVDAIVDNVTVGS